MKSFESAAVMQTEYVVESVNEGQSVANPRSDMSVVYELLFR